MRKSRGGTGGPTSPLDLRMQIAFNSPYATPRENLTLFRAKNEDADQPVHPIRACIVRYIDILTCYKQRFSIIVHCVRIGFRLKALSHYNVLANVCRRMKYISSTLAYAEI